eukprot:3580192-Rhodomonas_salina.1
MLWTPSWYATAPHAKASACLVQNEKKKLEKKLVMRLISGRVRPDCRVYPSRWDRRVRWDAAHAQRRYTPKSNTRNPITGTNCTGNAAMSATDLRLPCYSFARRCLVLMQAMLLPVGWDGKGEVTYNTGMGQIRQLPLKSVNFATDTVCSYGTRATETVCSYGTRTTERKKLSFQKHVMTPGADITCYTLGRTKRP